MWNMNPGGRPGLRPSLTESQCRCLRQHLRAGTVTATRPASGPGSRHACLGSEFEPGSRRTPSAAITDPGCHRDTGGAPWSATRSLGSETPAIMMARVTDSELGGPGAAFNWNKRLQVAPRLNATVTSDQPAAATGSSAMERQERRSLVQVQIANDDHGGTQSGWQGPAPGGFGVAAPNHTWPGPGFCRDRDRAA